MRRPTFGPVVLVGLASALLLAVASAKIWVSHDLTLNGKPAGVELVGSDLGKQVLAAPLSYVLLAGWGVLLVTRGWVRRAMSVLLVLVSLGLLAAATVGAAAVANDVHTAYLSQTRAGARLAAHVTGWYYAALAGAVLSVVTTGLAVRFCGRWPAMGRRYDAPAATRSVDAVDPDDPESANLALWRSIDEGQDPTETPPVNGR